MGHATRLLRDERKVRRQDTPYIAYSRERWGSGDYKNVQPADGARSISREWNALSKEVKQVSYRIQPGLEIIARIDDFQKYHDVYLEGRPAYAMEYERVYGRTLKQTPAEKKLLKSSTIEAKGE